jgi:hypothetical protein
MSVMSKLVGSEVLLAAGVVPDVRVAALAVGLVLGVGPFADAFSAAAPSHSRSRLASEKSWKVVTAMSRPLQL